MPQRLKWPVYLASYCQGKTYKEIAAEYNISRDTLRKTFQRVRRQYNAGNMGELVKKVIREGKYEL